MNSSQIQTRLQNALKAGPDVYWLIENPRWTVRLPGAIAYVNDKYPNTVGLDRFVYWPDYRVAGRIRDIYSTFRNAGINMVEVGTLNQMTYGKFGLPRQVLPLTPEVIAASSIDPLNPEHSLNIVGEFAPWDLIARRLAQGEILRYYLDPHLQYRARPGRNIITLFDRNGKTYHVEAIYDPNMNKIYPPS